MSWVKLLKTGFILGIALYVTFILAGLGLGLILPFLPLAMLGAVGGIVYIVLQILSMGLVGAIVLKYIVR